MNIKNEFYPSVIDMNNTESELNIKLRAYYALNDEYNKLVNNELKNNAKNANPWSKLKRNMNSITSANKEYIWGTGQNGEIFKCDQPCDDSKWRRVSGGLKQVSTDNNEVWGVNSSNRIYKKNVDNSNGWTRINGSLKNVSASGDKIWGVNSSDNIYNCSKPCNGNWRWKSGKLKQVSGDSDYVWGVNSNNNIYRTDVNGDSNWEKINGKGKWISAEAENDLYLVGTNNKLYKCEKPCNNGEWEKMLIDGTYIQVSGNIDSDNSFTTLNKFNTALKYKNDYKDKTGWTTLNGESNMSGLVTQGGESTNDWKYLGNAKNISECRGKAMNDTTKNDTIYSSVVYNTKDATENNFSKTCYAGVKGGATNKVKNSASITSYPPGGVTVIGGVRGLMLLNRIKLLNEEIEQLIKNYNVLLSSELKKSVTYKKKDIKGMENMKKLIKKLKKERVKIEKEIKKQQNLEAESENTSLTLVSNQYRYIGWASLAVMLMFLTFSQIKKST